ncbi:MAG: hypothetical protein F6K35_39605 [Okeania sp. SIO2H7]|nr:hypothetical protein [Okeania sp. SIO2H7]
MTSFPAKAIAFLLMGNGEWGIFLIMKCSFGGSCGRNAIGGAGRIFFYENEPKLVKCAGAHPTPTTNTKPKIL